MKALNKLYKMVRHPTKRKKVLVLLSGSLISIGWVADFIWNASLLFNSLMIISTLIAGFEIARKAWLGLKSHQTNIELLVTIAATGGIIIGVYWESAAVTFLFLLGGWLEARTINKTRNTLREIINLAPDTATIIEGETRLEIQAGDVKEGMLVLVKPGSKIPVDGIVVSGNTTVNESAITGESIPSEKQPESEVFAGTMNQQGSIRVRATKSGSNTTLAKIIRRVEEAQEEKAPTQRFIERFARWYTPGIVGLSIVSFLVTWNLELSLTLLVIGCPGALVIATPISVISGIGNAAGKGILIKGGEYLENAGNVSAIAFDKTGTLTVGEPEITEFLYLRKEQVEAGIRVSNTSMNNLAVINATVVEEQNSHREVEELLYWTGIAESLSEHPLADAIVTWMPQQSVPEPDFFQSYPGLGIEAEYANNQIQAGNIKLLKEKGVQIDESITNQVEELTAKGRTIVLTAINNTLLGGIGFADSIRSDARAMIERLRENGMKQIIILTGDTLSTAETVADELNIDEIYADLLPEEKNDVIKRLKEGGRTVAMIGDGINDAPALATADIGMAMGAAGTDVAIETADIALMSDDLLKIPEAFRLSSKTLSNIRQNVAIALITITALLVGVIEGSVHMAGGMLIHELSVIIVILNGMRLRWL